VRAKTDNPDEESMFMETEEAGGLREFSILNLGTDRNWRLQRPEPAPRVIYQMRGPARYHVDGRRHTLKAGYVLVGQGQLSGRGDSPFVEVQVPSQVFSEAPDILRPTRRSGKRRNAVVVKLDEKDIGTLESILIKLFREQELDIAGCDISVRATLLELLVFLYRTRLRILPHWQHYETLGSLISHKRVQGVIAYATAHCHESLNLDGLARMAGVNRTTFCRLHKTLTGTTPMKLLASARIERAKELLTGSRLPLAEISQRVGFADPPSFFRAFRHHCGITPLAYRRGVTGKHEREK